MTSTSRSSRSRTALPYSVRFRRWIGLCPGSGEMSACASRRCSSEAANRCSVASSGRGMPTGGIMPPRSLMMTFSHTSEWLAAVAGSSPSSDSPPVRARALWQLTRYLLDERLL